MVSLSSSTQPVWGYKQSSVRGCLPHDCLQLAWSSLPCWLLFSTRHKCVIQHPAALQVSPPPASRRSFWCDWEGGIPGSPLWGAVQSSVKRVGVFCSCTTGFGLSQIISNDIQLLMDLLSFSCEGQIYIKGTSLSCLVLLVALYKSRGCSGPWISFTSPISNLSALLFAVE